MKNKAKCNICKSVLESFHSTDCVVCNCGEISIDGGPNKFICLAKNWENFIRLDDKDNEIIPKIVHEKEDVKPLYNEEIAEPTYDELIDILDEMIKNIENLPAHAKSEPVNQYDMAGLMLLLSSIFKAKKYM